MYDGPTPGHSKQRNEPFSPKRFWRGHCNSWPWVRSACSILACSSLVPHHAGSTLIPNDGTPFCCRYRPPNVNELVMIGRTAKTFFSSTNERTARMFADG